MRFFAVLALSGLTAAGAFAADLPPNPPPPPPAKRTAYDDCLGKVKRPQDILHMQLHLLKDEDRGGVGAELAGVLACGAIAERKADPCASLTGIGKAIGGTDKRVEGALTSQCRQYFRFGSFYQEALRSSSKQRKFPLCMDYFRHISIIDVKPDFEPICARMAGFIRDQKEGFCDADMDPYLKSKGQWGSMCKVINEIYIRGDASHCSFFPAPEFCPGIASIVGPMQAGRADACGADLAGGICRALTPSLDKKVPRCKLPWMSLQQNYCRAMVASGIFGKAGGSQKKAGAEQGGDDSSPQPNGEAPSEDR